MLPGVDTAVTSVNVGPVTSTTKDVAVKVVAFPAASVTVTVGVYVPDANVLNVIVLFPEIAAVVLLKGKPLVIVPASSDENT